MAISPELLGYAREQMALGHSHDELRGVLLASGWKEEDIAEAFAILDVRPMSVSTSEVPMPEVQAPEAVVSPALPEPLVASSADISAEMSAEMPREVAYFKWSVIGYVVASICANIILIAALRAGGFEWSWMLISNLWWAIMMGLILLLLSVAMRTRKNWARFAVVAILLTNVVGLGISWENYMYFLPQYALVFPLVMIGIAIVTLRFGFSKKVETWFAFPSDSGEVASGERVIENKYWTKVIPRINLAFILIGLVLVFGVDFYILNENAFDVHLMQYWLLMIGVFAMHSLFFIFEKFVLYDRLSTTSSRSDSFLMLLVWIRNAAFILNYIPLIQLIGIAMVVFLGIPYLVIYALMLRSRLQVAKSFAQSRGQTS